MQPPAAQPQRRPPPGGLPAGMPNFSPDQMATVMGYLPKIIAFAQRLPVLGAGFFIGMLFWMVVIPLVTPSLLLDSESSSSSSADSLGAAPSSSWLPSFLGGGGASAADAAVEWDEAVASDSSSKKKTVTKKPAAAVNNNNKRKTVAAIDDEEALDDGSMEERPALLEDEDDEESSSSSSSDPSSSSLIGNENRPTLEALKRCYLMKRALVACMKDTHSLFGHLFLFLVLAGILSDGFASKYREYAAEKAQHERAMDVVYDALQMERQESVD